MLRAEIHDLTRILDAEGLVSLGASGQERSHWALAQRRASLRLLYAVQRRIDLEDQADRELEAFLNEG